MATYGTRNIVWYIRSIPIDQKIVEKLLDVRVYEVEELSRADIIKLSYYYIINRDAVFENGSKLRDVSIKFDPVIYVGNTEIRFYATPRAREIHVFMGGLETVGELEDLFISRKPVRGV